MRTKRNASIVCGLVALFMISGATATGAVTADSTTWEGFYEADVLPDSDGFTSAGLASLFTTLPGDGTIRLNNLTAMQAATLGWWQQDPAFDFSTGVSVEIRAKVNDPNSGANAMTLNIDDGINDNVRFRLFGSSQVQMASGTSFAFQTAGVDVSQYQTYRMTAASGANNVNLYIGDSNIPAITATLEGLGSSVQGNLYFGDVTSAAGQASDWSIDYVRWTNQGAFKNPLPPSPPVTALADRIGVTSTFTDYANLAMQTRQAGAGWIRINFPWSHFEPASKGSYNWTELDELVNQAQSRGLKIMATLTTTPEWARGAGTSTFDPATDPQDWSDAVTAVVSRYQDNVAWGIWNEPNLPGFWGGTRQEFMTDILRVGIDAIKAADPDALILAGDLSQGSVASGSNYFDWQGWMTDIVAEGGADIDALAIHLYRNLAGEATDAELTAALDANKSFYQQFGKPVWLTETGWQESVSGEQGVADNYQGLLQTWLTGDANRDWIEKFFFFHLTPSGTPVDQDFNLVLGNGDPKSAYLAIQDFAAVDGDVSGDGFVGIEDLNIVLGAWNQSVNPGDFLAGDPSGDGFVGIEDLNVVLGNWNAGTPPPAEASNTVPEPATLLLFGLGLNTLVRRKTRQI